MKKISLIIIFIFLYDIVPTLADRFCFFVSIIILADCSCWWWSKRTSSTPMDRSRVHGESCLDVCPLGKRYVYNRSRQTLAPFNPTLCSSHERQDPSSRQVQRRTKDFLLGTDRPWCRVTHHWAPALVSRRNSRFRTSILLGALNNESWTLSVRSW